MPNEETVWLMHRPRIFPPLLSSAAILFGAAQASAQGVTPLDVVTVTGTRTPEVAGDVAAPLSVVPYDELRRRQPQNLHDILRFLPGVEVEGLPRSSVLEPQIRGLSGNRVVLRTDGVRQNFVAGHKGRLFLDPEFLRQADVLRGPGTLLYGSGALGGVLNLRTIEAADLLAPGRRFTAAGFGGFQTANDQWRLGSIAAFREGALDGVFGVVGRSGHNFRDGAGRNIPFSAADNVQGLAKIGWTVGDGFRLGFSSLAFGENALIPFAANTTATTNISKRRQRQWQTALNAEIAPPGQDWLDLAATLYYAQFRVDERRVDSPARPLAETDLDTVGLDVANTTRFSLFGADRNALTIGFDGFRDLQRGALNGAPRAGFPDAEQTVVGVFAQHQLTLGRLTLTGGLRYDRYDQEATGQRSRSDDRLSPKLSAAVQVTDWLAPYVAYAEAFRAPSLTEIYATGVHFPVRLFPLPPIFNVFVPNPDLRPETAKNKEAGVNLRFRNVFEERDSLRGRISLFQTDYDDFIELRVTATTTEARNVRSARIRGVEAEFGYDGPAWFATLTASALRGDDRTGNRPLALIPAHKAGLIIGRRFAELGLVAGGRFLAVATQDRKPDTTRETSGYGLLDLFLSWEPLDGPLAGLRLDLGVDNLFDQPYRRLAWDSGPTPAPFYDVGRNIKIALRAQF